MRDVIIACDFKNKNDLYNFLGHLGEEKPYLKIGMEIFYKEGPELVKQLKAKGYKIFLDLKLHDIPNTVKKAMRNLGELGADIVNLHAAGGIKMMKAAKEGLRESGSNALLIAVTQLTSISEKVLKDELLINESMANTVKHYALNAKKAGLDGVVCSPLEAPIIKEIGIKSITPGIRFSSNVKDDQVRVSTPAYAKELGSDFIVVGRSITQAENPLKAYQRCIRDFV